MARPLSQPHRLAWHPRTPRSHRACLAGLRRKLRADDQPLRILDIAAGHGRYVVHALRDLVDGRDRILLRGFSENAVRQGQALIHDEGMDGIARFERGDAFDFDSLQSIRPAPNLAVVSGLYELFPENHLL